MKTVYISKEQENIIRKSVINEGRWTELLTEENSSIKKKIKNIITEYCADFIKNYLNTPMRELPSYLKGMLCHNGQETAMFKAVADNPYENKYIDFLKLNLYDQMGCKRDKGPWEYIIGAARILCRDLGFYSFDPSAMRGGDIIKFSKMVRIIHSNPEFFLDGKELDRNLNGMDYDEFMSTFAPRYEKFRDEMTARMNASNAENRGYTIVRVQDRIGENGAATPVGEGSELLNMLGDYTDWCICGSLQRFEYSQYTAGGGAVYIAMKNGFESIEKVEGENCPLDEYGLSLVCIIVGPDGMPDNVTTRWNHEHGGENAPGLSTAEDIQNVLGIRYQDVFKPRSERELVRMHINESEGGNSQYVKLYHVEPSDRGRTEKEFARTGLWLSHFPDDSYGEIAYVYEVPKSVKIADEDTAVKFAVKYNREDLEYLAKTAGLDLEDGDTVEDARNEYLINPEAFLGENDWAGRLKESGYDGFEFEYGEYTYYYLFDPSVAKLCGKFDCEDWGELRPTLFENSKDKPSAMDQVHNKVNAGVMDAVTCGGMMEEDTIEENSNDRKVNKYIKEKFGLTDFKDIRNKVMEIYEAIPYARINGGKFMLGVMRILFEEGLPRDEYSVLNKILYKIANSNYYERQEINDPNLGGKTFEELKEKYFVPDFEGTEFSTSEKMVKLENGYTVTRIDSYDEMNARCDGEWCISYDDSLWYELVADGTVYLVENEELINKHDEAMDDKEYANQFGELCDIAGEEDDMDEMGLINSDLAWTNKPGSWKFPYDYYGLSRFVVIVYKSSFVVYSRYNMPNEFDGDYLTKGQLEKLLGIKFEDVFKFIPGKDGSWEYDEFGRKVPFGSVQHEMAEGAEPESDEYQIGGEGGNNEYFHAINEAKIGNFDFKKYFKPIAEFMRKDGLNVYPYPKVKLNWEPQDGLFIKTGYYEPESKTIVIFCDDRHPKDILRTFCHEMIHHSQNLDGIDLNFNSNDDVKDNERLEEIESEAYLKGNVYFRKWTEYQNKNNDLLQEVKERKNDKGETVPEKCDKCGGDVVCQIHGEPVFVCKDCGKYFGTMPCSLNESINIKKALVAQKERRDPDGIENLDEDTNPEDIDLSSFNIKTELNPKFWKNDRLDSRIRMKLLDIADDFIEFLGVDWVEPDDIIMTGSLANYNWNKKFSDIDLHILIDYSKVDKRKDFVSNYFYSQKKLWNDEHKDLKIFGFPVELYVQDTNEKHSSTGVYSLDKDKWVVEPERKKLKTAKINKSLIKKKVAEYIDKIDSLLDLYKTADDDYKVRKISEDAEKLFDEIKKERKSGLEGSDVEITNGNIIFKSLRRLGYIEKLVSLVSKTYDEMNSLSQ